MHGSFCTICDTQNMYSIKSCLLEAWAKRLGELSKNPKWTGRTPESAQEDHVSVAVLRFLHEHDMSRRVDDLWHAKCMPLWGLVRRKERGVRGFKPCFVVEVYSHCFIAWPAVEIAHQIWGPDLGLKSLETTFVLDLNKWEALPTRVRSPLAAAVRKVPLLILRRLMHVEPASIICSRH